MSSVLAVSSRLTTTHRRRCHRQRSSRHHRTAAASTRPRSSPPRCLTATITQIPGSSRRGDPGAVAVSQCSNSNHRHLRAMTSPSPMRSHLHHLRRPKRHRQEPPRRSKCDRLRPSQVTPITAMSSCQRHELKRTKRMLHNKPPAQNLRNRQSRSLRSKL